MEVSLWDWSIHAIDLDLDLNCLDEHNMLMIIWPWIGIIIPIYIPTLRTLYILKLHLSISTVHVVDID